MNLLRKAQFLLSSFLLVALTSSSSGLTGIIGWPLPKFSNDKPPSWLGGDPVLGRLICPAVSQYKLTAKQSEGLIFKDSEEIVNPQGKGVIWRYHLRSGIYWWSGKEVTSEDFALFIKEHLQEIVLVRTLEALSAPNYDIQILAGGVVEIHWQEIPKFGPYVFNGVPFYQKASDSSYECAGIYVPTFVQEGIKLSPSSSYKLTQEPLIFSDVSQKVQRNYEFHLAENFAPSLKDQAVCGNTIDLPWISAIFWNPNLAPTNDHKVRKLLTQLMPRGSLLRQGAGHLGQLASGIIPRNHPGYNKADHIRPFVLTETAKEFESLGFLRKVSHDPRLNNKGEPLVLRIYSALSGANLVKKVLKDSFWAVGIRVEFVDSRYEKNELHGFLDSFMFSWSEPDLLRLFHSKAKPLMTWNLTDQKLDELLLAYSLSLTNKHPDLGLLQKIHNALYSQEPASVLLHHKACFSSPKGKIAMKSVDDPEWFKDMVLQGG